MECNGTNAAGEPCGAPPELVDAEMGYCPAHAPDGPVRMREIASRGGKAAAAKASGGLHPDDLGELETFDDAKARLDLISRAVLSGRIESKVAQAAIRAVSEWVATEGERAANEDLEALAEELERLKEDLEGSREPWRAAG